MSVLMMTAPSMVRASGRRRVSGAGGAASPTTSSGYHFKFKLVLVTSQVPFSCGAAARISVDVVIDIGPQVRLNVGVVGERRWINTYVAVAGASGGEGESAVYITRRNPPRSSADRTPRRWFVDRSPRQGRAPEGVLPARRRIKIWRRDKLRICVDEAIAKCGRFACPAEVQILSVCDSRIRRRIVLFVRGLLEVQLYLLLFAITPFIPVMDVLSCC